jgi:hypothetical protein
MFLSFWGPNWASSRSSKLAVGVRLF